MSTVFENVLFLSGAAGATTKRTPAARWADIFNVKDYGAKGDSNITASTGTNDTGAIQSCVDAVSAAGGGTIYFPPGCYKIIAPITFTSNVCGYVFQGSGTANVLGTVGGSQIVGNFSGYLFDRPNVATSGALVRISDLGFRNGHASGSGIRLLGTDSSKIDHCAIQAAQFGIALGSGPGSPPNATWTANSSGTNMTVSGIVGTIDSFYFPLFISGTGVTNPTYITAQQSGTTGSNGVYTTSQATTCSGSIVTSGPSAPTSFGTVVENCAINGLGAFNINPALSYTGVGIQMSPETMVRGCHLDNWASAIRGYGLGNYIYGCQMESNTVGVLWGTDGSGANFAVTAGVISGSTIEGCVYGIQIISGNRCVVDAVSILAEGSGHNSTYGLLIDGCDGLSIRSIDVQDGSGGTLLAGIYLRGFSGAIRKVHAECCDASLGKDASVNYSCITAVQCKNFPVLSCTLAQLNTTIAAGDVNVGERRLINDSNTVLASQVYNATVTGGVSNLASVWYDGTTVRYG